MTQAQLKWKKNHDSDFPGYVAIEKYYNGAAETTSSIVASLDAHCRYMKLQCVIDLLSEDEIKISESFGYSNKAEQSSTGKRILFIVTSEDKRYYDWIPSMVYSLFFDELYHLTAIDPKLHETLPHHLTFLMDEFANVTLPDSFVEKLSTMRSRNMSAVIIVQNLIQLKRKFPKFDMDKDLIGNCSIIDILGAPDMDSCEYLSKHFGTQTIHKASDSDAKDYKGSSSRSEDVMQKPLLSAEDIFAMKKDGECAIVIKGADPLFETKCRMEKTAFEKHNLMMSLVQGTEKSDVDIDADKDVDVKSKKLFCCPLFKKRKEKGSKTKGKELYKELAGYIMESEYLSAAQIEQLRLAAKAGMPQEDILRLAKRGKEPMEIRKCVEFYEMTKNR